MSQMVTEDIKDELETAGIGTFGGTSASEWNIYISNEPAEPDRTITLFMTGGPAPQYTMDRSIAPCKHELFQVRVRGDNYPLTADKVIEIQEFLDQFGPFNGADDEYRYDAVFADSGPLTMPHDDGGRYIFVLNYRAVRKLIA